ncbi:bacterioferritin [Pseudaeromonas paramecii]|uniref:Bacterioferritin n=1 Tax=Pseudaeromonas paramecii TaxID=2138166 RepID=A0ABP8QIJ3_9GAMM
MQGDKQVIAMLNRVLTSELTSINQYFLHARMLKHQGLNQLNDKAYKKSIKDMKQADELIERVLFLEGFPNLQRLDHLRIGETPEEMLRCDTELQHATIGQLKEAIALCESSQDYVSRDLLAEQLEEEEEYLDWLETQANLIAQTGLANYLQSMI